LRIPGLKIKDAKVVGKEKDEKLICRYYSGANPDIARVIEQ
jgi:hypothetical protein